MSDTLTKEYTANLNLVVIPTGSTAITFLAARDDIYGNKSTSNMQIIDGAIGSLQQKSVYILEGESVITNQYVATNDSITSLTADFPIIFTPDENNTGASTLTLNGFAAKHIKKIDGSGSLVAISANDLIINNPILIYYSVLNDAFILTSCSVGSLPDASTTQSGIVMLTNATDSTSEILAPTAAALKIIADAVDAVETALDGKAPTSHTSADTTYGVATGSLYGHVKLYTATGTNTDGTMTQAATSTAITNAKPVAGTGIELNGTYNTAINIKPPTESVIGGVKAGDNISIAEDGTISTPSNPTALPPNGSAGGDLTGSYPNPTIASNAVTDTKIGNRTVDQAIETAFSSTGTLLQLLSWVVKAVKNAVGKDNWYDAPTATLEYVNANKANKTHASTHATGQLDAVSPASIGAEPTVSEAILSAKTIAFSEAATRTNIATTESLATLFGKVKKFFTDLKTVAFTGVYTDLTSIPTSFAPSSHKSSHATGQSDALAPSDIGAQSTLTSATASLTVAGWSSNSQSVTVSGVTSSNIVWVSPSASSLDDYVDAGIICTTQGTNSLTFTCVTVPTSEITINIVIAG